MALTKAGAPSPGTYYENGTRLIYVLGLDQRGYYQVEDCKTGKVELFAPPQLESWQQIDPTP